MRFVRLLKIRSHFCQNFIGRDSNVDRKTKVFINIVADISSALFRGRKTGSDRGIVQKTFIYTDLLDFRRQGAEKADKLLAVTAVRIVIGRNDRKGWAFFQGICHRLCGVNMIPVFRRQRLCQNNAVAGLPVAADDGGDHPDIHTVRVLFQKIDRAPAQIRRININMKDNTLHEKSPFSETGIFCRPIV